MLEVLVRKVIVLEINNDAHAQAKNGQGSGKEFPQEEFRLKLVQYEDPATNALSTCVIGRETQKENHVIGLVGNSLSFTWSLC